MIGYLKRLLRTGSAYQAAELVAKAVAVITLPLYTRHVDRGQYGAYQALFTAVILMSILLRAGIGEAFVRFYFEDADEQRRRRIAHTATATVAWTTTAAAVVVLILAAPLSRLLLGYTDASLLRCADLGLWAFTNLEMAYAQLRVQERAGTYLRASAGNVALTVVLTLSLVVFAGAEAEGLLLGNFIASAVVVLGLWWTLRRNFSLHVNVADLRAMLHFGLPTIPADASVYALQVADRLYLYRSDSHAAAGEYSVALQLATVVFVFVRGFQYAWPPLAYSIQREGEAARLYSLVCTYFVLLTGSIVVAVALAGRWLVHLLAAPEYFGASRALPWLALGWTLYGLYLVMLAITARAKATRRNVPAALAGLAVNIALLFLLVPSSGLGLGLAGAGIALCAAYAVMVGFMLVLTRRLLAVPFEWLRLGTLALLFIAVSVSGELLLPTSGALALIERLLWWLLLPVALHFSRFFSHVERERVRAAPALAKRWVAERRQRDSAETPPEIEAFAADTLREL